MIVTDKIIIHDNF